MAGNDTLRFYYPWPAYGVKMSRQWPNVRENFQALAPLVRAAYVDLQPASAHDAGENDLSGLAIGERDFRNRFRTWYDSTNNMFKIQRNTGTEAVPVWSDAIQIRESDLRVIISGSGGIQSSVGGFYSGTPEPNATAVTSDFGLSTEWVFNHNLDAKPILWNAFRTNGLSIVPAKVDVTNRNTAYFYFNTAVAGTAIATGSAAGMPGVTFTDGTNTWTNKTRLAFNHTDFYLTPSVSGNSPVLNFRGSGGGVSAHSALSGLTVDDHSQYLLTTDATSRASFAANWLDLTDGGATSLHTHTTSDPSPGFYGVNFRETDDTPAAFRNDTLIFDSEYFYLQGNSVGKPVVSLRASVVDHGVLTGLSDDDHAQYLLTSDATSRVSFAANWLDLTDGGATTLHSHAAVGGGGGGFYGVYIRETDGSPAAYINDTITFDSAAFYIQSNSVGKPIVSLRAVPPTNLAYTNTYASNVEWQVNHALGTKNVVWSAYDSGMNAIIPLKVDTSDPSTAYFYYGAAQAGTAVILSSGGNPTGTTDHGSLSGLTDDDHAQYLLTADATNRATFAANWLDLTDGGATTLHSHAAVSDFYGIIYSDGVHTLRDDVLRFNPNHFYLSEDTGSKPQLNLRYDSLILPVFVETAAVQNIAIDPFAPYAYTIEQVEIDCKSGSCTAAFYIVPAITRNKNGISIGGLDPISVSTTAQTLPALSNNTVAPGDLVIMSIPANSTAKHVRVSLRGKTT